MRTLRTACKTKLRQSRPNLWFAWWLFLLLSVWTLLLFRSLLPSQNHIPAAWQTSTHNIDKTNPSLPSTITGLLQRHPSCQGKDHFLQILLTAKDSNFSQTLGDSVCRKLPTWEAVERHYGATPVIVGLETCEAYRMTLRDAGLVIPRPRIAGLYHSGTNAMTRCLETNLRFKRKYRGAISAYQVPWGKHVPVKYRGENLWPKENRDVNHTLVMPIVMVRDPFFWMQSLCRVPYDVDWKRDPSNRCPNLIRWDSSTTYNVTLIQRQTNFQMRDDFATLADLWSEWHRQYLDADFPRLMIRMEDALHHMEHILDKIRECIDWPKDKAFQHEIGVAKRHGNPADFLSSVAKLASWEGRHLGLTSEDRLYCQRALDPELMRIFHYSQAPLEAPYTDLP